VVPEDRLPQPQSLVVSFPGLVFYYYRDVDDGSVRLVSHWSSREAYIASCRPFARALGAGAPTTQGFVQALSLRRKPFWKRVSLYQVTLHAVALLGALSALQNYYAQLFEAPNVVVEAGGPEGLDFIAGQPLEVPVTFLNRSRNLPVEVRAITSTLVSLGHGEAKAVSLPAPVLPAPIQDKVTVTLRSPGAHSGLYNLRLIALTRSGYLRGSRESPPVVVPLRIWSREPETSLSRVEISKGQPWLYGTAGVSSDAVLFCQLRIFREPGIRIGPLDFPGVEQWPDPTPVASGENSVATQSWVTPPLRHFSPQSFRLALEGKPRAGWDVLVKNSHLDCSPQKGTTP
jgi:hypothetical protein